MLNFLLLIKNTKNIKYFFAATLLIVIFCLGFFYGRKSLQPKIAFLEQELIVLEVERDSAIEQANSLSLKTRQLIENAKKNQKVAATVGSNANAYLMRRLEEERSH